MKNELLSKSTEADALKSRNMELEEWQLRQDDAINAMKRQTKKICVSFMRGYIVDNKSTANPSRGNHLILREIRAF